MLQAWERARSSAALHDSPLTCCASGLSYCIHVVEHALGCSHGEGGGALFLTTLSSISKISVKAPGPMQVWCLLLTRMGDLTSGKVKCWCGRRGQVPERKASVTQDSSWALSIEVSMSGGAQEPVVQWPTDTVPSPHWDSAWCLHGVMTSCLHWPSRVLISDLKVKSSGSYYWPVQPATTFLYLILKMILGF